MVANTQIIRPTDFNRNTADKNRNTWTPGQMRHVIAAVNNIIGATVMIETAEGLLQEYKLEGMKHGTSHSTDLILSRTWIDDNGNEKISKTTKPLYSIGVIIVATLSFTDDPRHKAIRSYNDEISALIRAAKAVHGESEGRAYGVWNATPYMYDGTGWAAYTPYDNTPADAAKAGTGWSGKVYLTPAQV